MSEVTITVKSVAEVEGVQHVALHPHERKQVVSAAIEAATATAISRGSNGSHDTVDVYAISAAKAVVMAALAAVETLKTGNGGLGQAPSAPFESSAISRLVPNPPPVVSKPHDWPR